MPKTPVFILFLFLFCAYTYAQTATLTGFVYDKESGDVVSSGEIFLCGEDGKIISCTQSNYSGWTNRQNYTFHVCVDSGYYSVETFVIGYRDTLIEHVLIVKNKIMTQDIPLQHLPTGRDDLSKNKKPDTTINGKKYAVQYYDYDYYQACGKIKSIGNTKHGRPYGKWIYYYPDGSLQATVTYEVKLFFPLVSVSRFDPKGDMGLGKVYFVNRHRFRWCNYPVDTSIAYFPHGKMSVNFVFTSHGKFKALTYYYSNGNIYYEEFASETGSDSARFYCICGGVSSVTDKTGKTVYELNYTDNPTRSCEIYDEATQWITVNISGREWRGRLRAIF